MGTESGPCPFSIHREHPMNRFLLLGAVLTLCGSVASRADIAPDPMRAPSIQAMSATTVRMAEEDVTLLLGVDRVTVRVDFRMVNDGEEARLEVGFPEGEGVLQDVKVGVDGKESPTQVKRVPGDYRGWILFPVTFPAQGTTAVSVSYWVPGTSAGGLLGDQWVEYILRTGAAWAGPIGRATVTLRLGPGVSRDHLRGISPSGALEKDGAFVWEWREFEPAADIRVDFRRRTPTSVFGELRERLKQVQGEEELRAHIDLEECAWMCGEYAEVVEQCDWLLARQQARAAPISPWYRDRKDRHYVPWELRKARAPATLGREAEARDAARRAMPFLRELLAAYEAAKRTDTGPFQKLYQMHDLEPDWEEIRKGLEEMEKLAPPGR